MDNNSNEVWTSPRLSELIRIHEKHRLLYQPKHPDYFKRGLRQKAWKDISAQLKSSISVVKQKWENMRHYFVKMLMRHELSKWNDTGDGSVYMPTWEHWDEMQYLRPFINDRKLSFRNNVQYGGNDESSLVCEVDVDDGMDLIDGNNIDPDEELGDSVTADNDHPSASDHWIEWHHINHQRPSSQLSDSSDSVQVENTATKSQLRGAKRKKSNNVVGGSCHREPTMEKKEIPLLSAVKREPGEETASNSALLHFTSYVVETLKSLSKYQQDCAMVKIAQVLFEVQHSREDLNDKSHLNSTSADGTANHN